MFLPVKKVCSYIFSLIKLFVVYVFNSFLALIRQALGGDMRLDGRKADNYRKLDIRLSRNEQQSSAEIVLGGTTRVICVVSGEIVAPYPDRPTEGYVHIHMFHILSHMFNFW